jgi:ketosteroid isomerase-like protein
MAKFTSTQAADWVSIQQLVNDWGYELDIHNGANIANLVTEDVVYHVRGAARDGRDAVVDFYKTRLTDLAATPAGVPVHRHAISNHRIAFDGADSASVTFTLVYFSTAMAAAGADPADPVAVADVQMNVRRCNDGHWRIASMDSAQALARAPK